MINVVLLKGRYFRIVERLFRFSAGDDDVAFVELQSHATGYVVLRAVNRLLEHFALRRKPVTVIHQLRIAWNPSDAKLRGP